MTSPVSERPPDSRASGRPSLVRRLVPLLAILVAIGLFVLAGQLMDTSSSDDVVTISGDIVERLVPADGEEALSQSQVAIDLAPGWGLEQLTVNGTEVPEPEWDVTAELGLYEFLPAGGLSVESLQTDENCVSATIFRLDDLTNTRVVSWCFTAF